MSSVVPEMQNYGTTSNGLSSTDVCASSAVGCTYPYGWAPSYWPNSVYVPEMHYHLAPMIDYDLLADKIADRIKGTKERSKEDIRKEINKLLSELEKAK